MRPRVGVLSRIIIDNAPLPLGGEGGPQPALSSAGAGRVRGSLPICSLSAIEWDRTLGGCGKTRCRSLCSAGILPASDESKGVAGWKPALRPAPKEFFRNLLETLVCVIPPPKAKPFAAIIAPSDSKRVWSLYVSGRSPPAPPPRTMPANQIRDLPITRQGGADDATLLGRGSRSGAGEEELCPRPSIYRKTLATS